MIGKLRGIIDEVSEGYCVIDVGGVGYVAWCPSAVLADLEPGAAAVLWIETHVREDVIRLYGFRDSSERAWFRLLQDKVQGVGAKVALAVLSVLAPADLAAAIDAAAAYLTHVEGLEDFPRQQLMRLIAPVEGAQDREAVMRSFGILLRDERLRRSRRGQFESGARSAFAEVARRFGHGV